EGQTRGPNAATSFDFKALHAAFGGRYIANNGYQSRSALSAIEATYADMVAFCHLYISNPDLVERLKRNAPLAGAGQATYYAGGSKGYTDYKTLEEAAVG